MSITIIDVSSLARVTASTTATTGPCTPPVSCAASNVIDVPATLSGGDIHPDPNDATRWMSAPQLTDDGSCVRQWLKMEFDEGMVVKLVTIQYGDYSWKFDGNTRACPSIDGTYLDKTSRTLAPGTDYVCVPGSATNRNVTDRLDTINFYPTANNKDLTGVTFNWDRLQPWSRFSPAICQMDVYEVFIAKSIPSDDPSGSPSAVVVSVSTPAPPLSSGAIAGIVIGAIVAFAVCVLLSLRFYNIRRRRKEAEVKRRLGLERATVLRI